MPLMSPSACDDVGEANAERVGELEEDREARIALAALDPADVGAVPARELGKAILGDPDFLTRSPQREP